jgi:flavin reductase (DIM6/NTAB) family NADH-FMN oxidoreductase RutF/rubrerythrin
MKKWRCTVCNYVHEGPEPPDVCPVCGVPKEAFVEVKEKEEEGNAGSRVDSPKPDIASKPSSSPAVSAVEERKDDISAGLRFLTYGMFVVGSRDGDRINAQTCNTVFQITGSPVRLGVGINKNNLTHEFIKSSSVFSVTILGKGNMSEIKHFGFQSGRNADKFAGTEYHISPNTKCPILPSGAAYLECEVRKEMSVDVGTHTLFIADVVGGGPLTRRTSITYDFYHQNRSKPGSVVDDVDWNNVVASLNLEYGANRRYQYQMKDLTNPRLVSVLEGVMRTEDDHVDNAIRYLESRQGKENGFARASLHMRLNLEFEEIARATYSQFADEADDPYLKDLFREQARSEMGHINIFKEIVESLDRGDYPAVFFCPVCGWELDFGSKPQEGDETRCEKCGANFKIELDEGNWGIHRVS